MSKKELFIAIPIYLFSLILILMLYAEYKIDKSRIALNSFKNVTVQKLDLSNTLKNKF